MVYPETFEALGISDYDKWDHIEKFEYKPLGFRDYDVDIKIDCCGVCASDVFGAKGGWGRPYAPVAFGHEIIGTVIRAGPNVKGGLKQGDRVGVGFLRDADGTCPACLKTEDNHCIDGKWTAIGFYPEENHPTQGGNASHIRVNSKFAYKIPENIESVDAAPILCAGATAYAPLARLGVTKGTKVGVVGVGGVGHMAIAFASAMGAEVTVISRNEVKKKDALELGGANYISSENEEEVKKAARTLDIVLYTSTATAGKLLDTSMSFLKPHGELVFLTVPPLDQEIKLNPITMFTGSLKFHVSFSASTDEVQETLQFASKHNIKPWVKTFDISDTALTQAWRDLTENKPHYRYVMTGFDKYFKQ